jgi:IgGFc binding protein
LLPFDKWQYSYVGVPFANHVNGQFRIVSARNQTNVAVTDGNSGAVTNYTLNAGEFVELLTTSAILVNADKPIQGMQLFQSQDKEFVPNPNGGGGPIGDPMTVGIPKADCCSFGLTAGKMPALQRKADFCSFGFTAGKMTALHRYAEVNARTPWYQPIRSH